MNLVGRETAKVRFLRRSFAKFRSLPTDHGLGELPRDRGIITYCQTGQRSYNAARILSQHGFRVRNLTGSYRIWRVTQPQ